MASPAYYSQFWVAGHQQDRQYSSISWSSACCPLSSCIPGYNSHWSQISMPISLPSLTLSLHFWSHSCIQPVPQLQLSSFIAVADRLLLLSISCELGNCLIWTPMLISSGRGYLRLVSFSPWWLYWWFCWYCCNRHMVPHCPSSPWSSYTIL